ncbi:MAG: hypothetical protein Kow00121_64070 [Elainellaceae cyanobacterium]
MARQLAQQFGTIVNSLLIATGLIGSSALVLKAHAIEASASAESATPASALTEQSSIPDGVYLYGESPEPDQIGSAYLVFAVDDNQVTGAFYQPRSSFDCFQGEFQGDRLNLSVINSYNQTTHPYSVAVQSDSYVASASDPITAPAALEGYHHIRTVSENDQRILETCQADF